MFKSGQYINEHLIYQLLQILKMLSANEKSLKNLAKF